MFAFYTSDDRSDCATASIAGGVVGGLVGIVLIAVIHKYSDYRQEQERSSLIITV